MVVFGDSKETCMVKLAKVLSQLCSCNLKLKPKKCKLFRRTKEFQKV